MSWKASNLSDVRYGYDFVVSTTQGSINATMLDFLSNISEPVTDVCFITDDDDKLKQVNYKEFREQVGGIDLFSDIPDGTTDSDPRVKALWDAGFTAGFRAQLGVPPVSDATTIPDMVILGADASQIHFNMLCSQFIVAEIVEGRHAKRFHLISQQTDAPWIFSSVVDLRLSKVEKGAFDSLPPDVQSGIKNIDDNTAFSVQQLLVDLTTAKLAATLPTITGLDKSSVAMNILTQYYLNSYFNQMSTSGQPLLGYSISKQDVDASKPTFQMTDLNLATHPYISNTTVTAEQQHVQTLSYLCAVQNHTLPPPVPFTWNWLDPSLAKDVHGVVSINRNTFANWFRQQLSDTVNKCCLAFSVVVTYHFPDGAQFNVTTSAGGTPTEKADGGANVLKYTYHFETADQAGVDGAWGKCFVSTDYKLSVNFQGSQIFIMQQLLVRMDLNKASSDSSANVVDQTIMDVYSIGVDQNGKLIVSDPQSQRTDNSQTPNIDAFRSFFLDYNGIAANISNHIREFTSTNFKDIPLHEFQNFIFPGGKTFAYKSAAFSNNQDLVGLVTYAS